MQTWQNSAKSALHRVLAFYHSQTLINDLSKISIKSILLHETCFVNVDTAVRYSDAVRNFSQDIVLCLPFTLPCQSRRCV